MTAVLVFLAIFAVFVFLLVGYLVRSRGYRVKSGGPPRMGGGGFDGPGGTNP